MILGFLPCCVIASSVVAAVPSHVGMTGLLGYVGPGAGLSMLSALVAVACVVVLALLGPVLYPLHLILLWLRRRRKQKAALNAGCAGDAAVSVKVPSVPAHRASTEQAGDDCPPGGSIWDTDDAGGNQMETSHAVL